MGSLVDITGRRFGRLTAVHYEPRNAKCTYGRWLCVCDCGARVSVITQSLTDGRTASCGCLHADQLRTQHVTRRPEIGAEHGYLRVVGGPVFTASVGRLICQCDCGWLIMVDVSRWNAGSVQSCPDCRSKVRSQIKREFYLAHPERTSSVEEKEAVRADWRKRNRQKLAARVSANYWKHVALDPIGTRAKKAASSRALMRLQRAILGDLYIKKVLTETSNLRASDIPAPLIEAKRALLKLQRLIKEKHEHG